MRDVDAVVLMSLSTTASWEKQVAQDNQLHIDVQHDKHDLTKQNAFSMIYYNNSPQSPPLTLIPLANRNSLPHP
jgi:hypothetical protein